MMSPGMEVGRELLGLGIAGAWTGAMALRQRRVRRT
jgi:hypothetical protein